MAVAAGNHKLSAMHSVISCT